MCYIDPMPRYYVSGIIQIEVAAKNEVEAGKKALARAESMMRQSSNLNIGIEVETAELTHPEELSHDNQGD